MNIDTYVERKKVDKAFITILVAACIILSAVDIFIHIKWWGGIGLFFSTVGAFALFGLISFVFLGIFLDKTHTKKIDDILIAGALAVALLFVPIKYLHFYNPMLPSFWLVCTPFVCIVSWLLILIPFYVKHKIAFNKDKETEEMKRMRWSNMWSSFILDEDAIACFKEVVEHKRRGLNLRYAKYNCMRQVLPACVVVKIANADMEELQNQRELPWFFEDSMNDGYFDELNISKWCFAVEHPMPSFAGFITEFKFDGRRAYVAIKMSVTGECLVCMDGKRMKYSETEFRSWDEMLKFLDKKLGIEA